MSAARAATVTGLQPVVVASLNALEAQPLLFANAIAHARLAPQSPESHPPTLLQLACALTI